MKDKIMSNKKDILNRNEAVDFILSHGAKSPREMVNDLGYKESYIIKELADWLHSKGYCNVKYSGVK